MSKWCMWQDDWRLVLLVLKFSAITGSTLYHIFNFASLMSQPICTRAFSIYRLIYTMNWLVSRIVTYVKVLHAWLWCKNAFQHKIEFDAGDGTLSAVAHFTHKQVRLFISIGFKLNLSQTSTVYTVTMFLGWMSSGT